MAEVSLCPQCGCELPPDAPGGQCPDCLLAAGINTEDVPLQQDAADSQQATTPPGAFVAPPPDELAEYFPQLEIEQLIGQGGMGAVYKAVQSKLGRPVALKIIRPEAAADPTFAERFAREARTLALLNHPHIITVYDFGEVDVELNGAAGKLYYFVMEYVDGVNLRQMLAAKDLTAEQALAIVPQICDALQFAHDEGVVHRDIKPENILIDTRGRVKIADFGLAKLVAHTVDDFTLTGTFQVMGTPRYMAPEQMTGARLVDHRADIYSLGVVLYEMLTGDLPLGRFQPPSASAAVDARLDEVVFKTLEREPEARYQQASDVKSDVTSISQVGAGVSPATHAATAGPRTSEAAPQPTAGFRRKQYESMGMATAAELPAADAKKRNLSVVMLSLGVLNGSLPLVVAGCVFFARIADRRIMDDYYALAVICVPGSLMSIPIILGGIQLRAFRSQWLATVGAVAMILPLSPLWPINVALGIWALMILFSRDANQPVSTTASLLQPVGKPPMTDEQALKAAQRQVSGPAIGMTLVTIATALPILLLVLWVAIVLAIMVIE